MNGSVRLSVRPSVRLSVRHTFLTMFPSSYHHEIFRSYYQWQKWRPCKRLRSKVKVAEVRTQLYRFRTVTPVWIHIWWRNDAYSLIMLRRGALLFFKVIRQISRSHGSKNRGIFLRMQDCLVIGHGLLIFGPSNHRSVSFCVCLSICLSLCLSSNWPWSSRSNLTFK